MSLSKMGRGDNRVVLTYLFHFFDVAFSSEALRKLFYSQRKTRFFTNIKYSRDILIFASFWIIPLNWVSMATYKYYFQLSFPMVGFLQKEMRCLFSNVLMRFLLAGNWSNELKWFPQYNIHRFVLQNGVCERKIRG